LHDVCNEIAAEAFPEITKPRDDNQGLAKTPRRMVKTIWSAFPILHQSLLDVLYTTQEQQSEDRMTKESKETFKDKLDIRHY